MDWQFDNSIPIYTQLIYKFRLAIASGELLPGDKLAAVRELATQAGVNPNTMQRAFQELERLGLVYALRSSGRYVTEDMKIIYENKKALAEEHIRKFVGSMKELGFDKKQILELIEKTEEQNGDNIGM